MANANVKHPTQQWGRLRTFLCIFLFLLAFPEEAAYVPRDASREQQKVHHQRAIDEHVAVALGSYTCAHTCNHCLEGEAKVQYCNLPAELTMRTKVQLPMAAMARWLCKCRS